MIKMPNAYTFDRVGMSARLLSGHSLYSRSQTSGDLLGISAIGDTYCR